MDIRVYPDINELNKYNNKNPALAKSFVSKTLEEYKRDYVDKYLVEKPKGIMKDFRIKDFELNNSVRKLNIITYRILNFILYSFLLGSYILNNLNEEEIKNILLINLFPQNIFELIKKGWELLNNSLKEIGIENAQIFINMTFDKIIQLMNNLEAVDTLDKFESFEKSVNDYILEIIYNKNNIEQLNKDYKQLNDQLLNLNPLSIKEIIQSNYDPSIYPKDIYPDIQYYTFSIIQDFNTFAQKFNSSDENKKKYALINILINKEDVLTKNAINMKYLKSINKLSNLLLNIYSYKINREDGKLKKLKNE